MSVVNEYPNFVPLDLSLKDAMHPRLSLTHDGVSEFTFAGLYLFRDRYNYKISHTEESFIISGKKDDKNFFLTPCGSPKWEILQDLFKTHDYWKNVSVSVLEPVQKDLESKGVQFLEDRDNFDYLYLRTDLAELPGKKFHKKKNLVNQFLKTYTNYEQRPLTAETVKDAMIVLDKWHEIALSRDALQDDGDFKAAKEALDLYDVFNLKGSVFYIDGNPAAYCSGESIARGKMFAIHFEKAIDIYKGIYQFVNKSFAESLPNFFTYINREQDLGDEGLRQAKETYRPIGFVKKYKGIKL